MRSEALSLCDASFFFNLMRCEAKHSCSPTRVYFLSFFLSRRGVCVAIDLKNGTSENIHSNVKWKYRHWICTISFPIFNGTCHFDRTSRTKNWFFAVISIFEIIKMIIASKVRRYYLWQLILYIYVSADVG
jgi:hypothetical protein